MAHAQRDENNVPTLLGTLSTDGVTPVAIAVDPSNHGLSISDGTTGIDYDTAGTLEASRDSNFIPTLLAVSSRTITVGGVDYIQGVTPVVVYADSTGHLLVDTQ